MRFASSPQSFMDYYSKDDNQNIASVYCVNSTCECTFLGEEQNPAADSLDLREYTILGDKLEQGVYFLIVNVAKSMAISKKMNGQIDKKRIMELEKIICLDKFWALFDGPSSM